MDLYEGSYLYCPACRTEYRPGITQFCADCGTELVHELPPEAAPSPDLEALQSRVGPNPVEVLVTGSQIQAQIARGVLIDAAIPCSVWSSGYHNLPLPYRVMVHREDEAEARELLAAQFADSGDE